jgi:hypothetical protein
MGRDVQAIHSCIDLVLAEKKLGYRSKHGQENERERHADAEQLLRTLHSHTFPALGLEA